MSTTSAERRLSSLAAVLAALLPLLAAAGEALRPEALAGPRWDGPQFVQADARGRLFLLRVETLEVYPVAPDGELGEPQPLETRGEPEGQRPLWAAMSRSGDWLIGDPVRVRLFRHGEEVALPPLAWPGGGVGFAKDRPLALVMPVKLRQGRGGAPGPDHPLVVEAGARRWSAFAEVDDELPQAEGRERWTGLRQRFAGVLAAGGGGSLWVGHHFHYRVRRFDPQGRLLLDLQVGDGEVEESSEAEVARARRRLEAIRDRRSDRERVGVTPNAARYAIRALAEGRDGRLYLAVQQETGTGNLVLDRYDPATGRLERLPLALSHHGALSLAAGREGLYLATFNGRGGRWRLPWLTLEEAGWASVEEVRIDDFEVPVPEPG